MIESRTFMTWHGIWIISKHHNQWKWSFKWEKSMRIKDKRSLSLEAYLSLSHICDRLYRLRHSSIWQEAEEQCCAQHGTAVEEWLSSKKYCKTRSKLRGKGKWVHSACTFYALIPSFCLFYKVEATSSPRYGHKHGFISLMINWKQLAEYSKIWYLLKGVGMRGVKKACELRTNKAVTKSITLEKHR